MKGPLGVSPSKANQGTTRGKEKNCYENGGNQTHNLRIRIFSFTWCGFLIPLTRAYAQWVLPTELILCSTICIVIGCPFFSTALGCISLLFLKCVKIKSRA